ncbi:ATP synthase F1 subunit epsilon [Sulfurospirillum sp. 1307]|jgi:F-type H+-transporting ATPase subunit epsilon
METLKLEIVTPDGMIFSDSVNNVTLPGSEGEFGVYPNHASLVSLLSAGIIDIELSDGQHEIVAVNWGHAKVGENAVTVLADGAVAIAGSDDSQVAESLRKAKELIESISDSNVAIAAATAKIESMSKSGKLKL